MKEITGITWDHSRAFPSIIAAAQRMEELHPGTRVRWEKRSLHEFGHMPIDVLATKFDLIVIDHPWAGFCFENDLIHDLNELISEKDQTKLEQEFIGPSFESYRYKGKLMALPIDAATPTPSWREDLIAKRGLKVPTTWDELQALADDGHVIMPGFVADLFLNWSMLVAALGAKPYQSRKTIADRKMAIQAIAMLQALATNMTDDIYNLNPIQIAERMTRSDDFAYCPFAYSYSNYCRSEFTDRPLTYGKLVQLDDEKPLRSVVGGTGIAISKSCKDVETALAFTRYCASAEVQSGIYTLAGGQPAHKDAWHDGELDSRCGNFFSGALDAQRNCIIRPRYNGYVPLQETGGEPLQACLKGEISPDEAFNRIDQAYQSSLPPGDMPEL